MRTFHDEVMGSVNKSKQWVLFILTSAGVLPMYTDFIYIYNVYKNLVEEVKKTVRLFLMSPTNRPGVIQLKYSKSHVDRRKHFIL